MAFAFKASRRVRAITFASRKSRHENPLVDAKAMVGSQPREPVIAVLDWMIEAREFGQTASCATTGSSNDRVTAKPMTEGTARVCRLRRHTQQRSGTLAN